MSNERVIETPEQFTDLKKECIERVRFYIDKANNKLGLSLPMPRVIFSITGTTAGKAWIGRNTIEFNPILLRDNIEEFLGRTPGHEVGHHAAHAKFGHDIKPHGYEWGKVMWALGLPAVRCHNYDTTNVARRGGVPVRRATSHILKTSEGTVKQIGTTKIIEFD